jgi:hypothetical protein
MANRTVTDSSGREWTCDVASDAGSHQGRDVMLLCATPSVSKPVNVKVGWQWESMADNGLARMISLASPVPKK